MVICNLIGEAAMLAFHVAPLLALRLWRHRQRRRAEARRLLPLHVSPKQARHEAGSGTSAGSTGSCPSTEGDRGEAEEGEGDGSGGATASSPAANSEPGRPSCEMPAALKDAPAVAGTPSTLRPPIPLMRGMTLRVERWQRQRPVLHRRLALAAIGLTFTGCCSLQILAPGFVDVSIGACAAAVCASMGCSSRNDDRTAPPASGPRGTGLAGCALVLLGHACCCSHQHLSLVVQPAAEWASTLTSPPSPPAL